jgi:gamma-glutamyltranspeptidase/glutathione hydrolase
MLELGGNAVDALCAAGFAAFIAEGLLCSPAGGGAALIGDIDHGLEVLDFFSVAPGKGVDLTTARKDFHAVDVEFGPTVQQFHVGRASAAVPGALQGVLELHARRGALPLRDVVAPAVEYGRRGFTLEPEMAYIISILAPIIDLSPVVQSIFRPGGVNPVAGETMVNGRLADVLEAVGRDGPAFFDAVVAPALVAAFGPAQGGLLTATDLGGYAPVWRVPLQRDFGPQRVFTNPPPSSGGTLIALGLRLVNPARLAAQQFLSPGHVRIVAELLAAVSDAKSLVPLDEAWVTRMRRQLGSTTHISVMDERGEVAAMTMSNGEGSGYALDELGIVVNNFLGEEDINPHGFHTHAAGERMTTMMAPTAVVTATGPSLVLGSGGSNRIRSAILQTLLSALVFERPLAECIDAPRLHAEDGRVYFESEGLPAASIEALQGGTAFESRNMYFGGVHAVARQGSTLIGAADPRRGGVVMSVG